MSCLSMNIRIRKARFGSYAHQPVAGPLVNTAERVKIRCPQGGEVYRSEHLPKKKTQRSLQVLRSTGALASALVGYARQVLAMVVSAVGTVFGKRPVQGRQSEAFDGKQLGQYRVIARLGAGGMGEVYLAEHRLLERPCAIKLIKPDRAGNPQVLARFEREIRMTARLSHRNTVEIFDCGRTEDGTLYYVMEYLPGLSLEDLLEQYGPQPPERVVHVLRQICHALREAHGIGLIHRDIKPANIIVAQRGGLHDVAKLLDFGLVRSHSLGSGPDNLTEEGAVAGTPAYMSPEHADGNRDLGARSDIYSLGQSHTTC